MTKSKKEQTNHIIFILDRSGSMDVIKTDTIGGFNSFVEKMRSNPGTTRMTLVQFDDRYEVVYENQKIDKVKDLNTKTYEPRGMTALLDAIGRTIKQTLKNKNRKADKTICVVLTDGHENHSTKYTVRDIHKLVTKCKDKRGWKFLFLGADIDAYDDAMALGYDRQNIAAYDPNTMGTRKAFAGAGVMAMSMTMAEDDEEVKTTLDEEYEKAD
jgi:uncharacterized protein YegL